MSDCEKCGRENVYVCTKDNCPQADVCYVPSDQLEDAMQYVSELKVDVEKARLRTRELEAMLAASQADVAALREVLKRAISDLVVVRGAIIAMHDDYWKMGGPLWARIHDAADRYGAALASDSPGDKIMAVVEAARTLIREDECPHNVEALIEALDALGEG